MLWQAVSYFEPQPLIIVWATSPSPSTHSIGTIESSEGRQTEVKVEEWAVRELKVKKWLGDQFCNGLNKAVVATIPARAGKLVMASGT